MAQQIDEQEKAYLDAAAGEVYRQMEENPGVPIPVDPDVAEYMGAFEEDAMDLASVLDDADVTVTVEWEGGK